MCLDHVSAVEQRTVAHKIISQRHEDKKSGVMTEVFSGLRIRYTYVSPCPLNEALEVFLETPCTVGQLPSYRLTIIGHLLHYAPYSLTCIIGGHLSVSHPFLGIPESDSATLTFTQLLQSKV